MSPATPETMRLGDPALLDKIDRLRGLNVSEYIPLPQVNGTGICSAYVLRLTSGVASSLLETNQGMMILFSMKDLSAGHLIHAPSGKSSALEGLTDLPFPRGSGVCTRFAMQITLRRAPHESVTVSIIPAISSTQERSERLKAFRRQDLESLEGSELLDILREVRVLSADILLLADTDVMGIPGPGHPRELDKTTFTNDALKIELWGPEKQHLSIIDIPGIFRTPTSGVTTKEDTALVRQMVHSYIENPRTIILAVIPANTDVATQEILTMAEEVDPKGHRTLGVLTKPVLLTRAARRMSWILCEASEISCSWVIALLGIVASRKSTPIPPTGTQRNWSSSPASRGQV